MGTNVSTTFIQCPADPKKTLGIKLPFLVMIIKNVCFIFLYIIFFFLPFFYNFILKFIVEKILYF